MKKKLPILIIFFIVIIFIVLLFHILKKEHFVNYEIISSKIKYNIEEKYYYDKGNDNYNFVIEDNNKNIFNFIYKKDLNKKKHIIEDIITYKKNKLICIVPKYIKDEYGNIYCNKNNKTYSYSYLDNMDDNDFKNIKKEIKKDGYLSNDLESSNDTKNKNKVSYYLDNIPEDYKFIMWNYTGINVIGRDEIKEKKLIKENDMYENKYSTMIGEYYIFLNSNNSNKLYYYNILNDKMSSIKNKKNNFTGEYIVLGSLYNKIYFIDTDKYIEYSLNPKKKKLEVVGDERNGYITYKDRKEIKVETSDMKNDPLKYKFVSTIYDDKIKDKYNTEEIYYYNDFYYFRSKDNNFYRSNSKYKNKPIYLFNINNVKYWSIYNDNILVITDKYLYYYNDNYGLKKIIKNEEFKYNYDNICLIFDGNKI